jgi:Tfp pilus assembly protein FimT
MDLLFAIVGALLSLAVPGIVVYLASKRTKSSDVSEELASLKKELDQIRSHAAKIRRMVEDQRRENPANR